MTPPVELDGARVLWWAWSGDRPFGVLLSTDGETGIDIHGLAICTYPSGSLYRFSCDRTWQVCNDTQVDSVDDAKRVPPQYAGVPAVWQARDRA